MVPRVADLSSDEISDLFLTVQRVGRMVERVFHASALNIALQDGRDAGQSVPHVHCHIIPRKAQDLGEDEIYGKLEGEEGDVGKHLRERDGERPSFPKVDEVARKPRGDDEMREEAERLVVEMEREGNGKGGAAL